MTQHIGLGSRSSQNALIWKGVPSPSFWSIFTPVLSSLIYLLYEKFQVLFVLYLVNGFNQYASALSQVCSIYIYTIEMAASNMADTITICRVNTYKPHMHLERNYYIYIHLFCYIVHTVMGWVAYKPPMPLQTQVLYIFPAYAMVFFLHMQWYSSRF